MEPKVSIVIPAYNASNYLSDAIDSALGQTYKNIEVIVVNDGSKDDGETERAALSYGDKIRYFRKENGGSSSALNTGIANMTGEWFSWLSHDDLYYPDKIEKQIKYIRELKVSGDDIANHVFFAASDLIDENGHCIFKPKDKDVKSVERRVSEADGNEFLIAEHTKYMFHGCSCLIHKSVFDKVGSFDESLRLLNDIDMWYRIYVGGYKIHYIPEIIVRGRIHSKQVSRSIGFSYQNPEQDMFWNRSFEWLKEHCPDNYEVFYLFGKNAFLKTRSIDGEKAFSYAASLRSGKSFELFAKKQMYKIRAGIRTIGKKVYLKLKT